MPVGLYLREVEWAGEFHPYPSAASDDAFITVCEV